MWRAIGLVLLSCALIGCLKFLKVVVDDSHSLQPVFRFCSRGLLGGTETVVPWELTVRGTGNESDDVLWKIEARAASLARLPAPRPAPLRQLQYGVTPDGCIVLVPPRPLAWGKTYRVNAALRVKGEQSVVGAKGEFTLTQREGR